MGTNTIALQPQKGPQEMFLRSSADIVIYGGGAGGGKSWAILMEPIRHLANPQFNATFFRRSYPQIKNPGGLWDASTQLYPLVNGQARPSSLRWNFPSGAYAVMRHLKLESNIYDWQGTELVYVAMDELTHFTAKMFWYMMSRMRSTSGVTPYFRGTCNPDPDSFVRELVDWWIGADGYPIPERSGQVRHFIRQDGELKWYDEPTRETKSFTFIPASVYDNPELLRKDPNYLNNLKALPQVERDRLLGGNWNVKAVAGKVFKSDWLPVIDHLPGRLIKQVRFWDFAGSIQQTAGHDPDWTVGAKLGLLDTGRVAVLNVFRDRLAPPEVERAVQTLASQDGIACDVRWFRDPGQAGNYQSERLRSLTQGYNSGGILSKLDKLTRAMPMSRAAELGELWLMRGPWNQDMINELIQFPDASHDDQVDAAAGGYQYLTGDGLPSFGQSRFR